MPIGPGGLDSNGIWLFGEDDSEALASDLLNLGMQSVSDAISGGLGAILQVVSTTKTDTFSASVASGGFSSSVTGLDATITPSSTSSKILVMVNVTGSQSGDFGLAGGRIVRDGSPIAVGDSAGSRSSITMYSRNTTPANTQLGNASAEFLDSPNTTSSTTYGFQIFNAGGSTLTTYVNRTHDDTNSATFGRSVSTITLMEVAG